MRRFLMLMLGVLMLAGLSGCGKHAIRDAKVYQAELTQWDTWATKLADLTADFMALGCTCDAEGVFTTKNCADGADYVLTVRARHDWHMQMALYNGSLLEERPSETPPVIPESKTLCPAAPAPEGGE